MIGLHKRLSGYDHEVEVSKIFVRILCNKPSYRNCHNILSIFLHDFLGEVLRDLHPFVMFQVSDDFSPSYLCDSFCGHGGRWLGFSSRSILPSSLIVGCLFQFGVAAPDAENRVAPHRSNENSECDPNTVQANREDDHIED